MMPNAATQSGEYDFGNPEARELPRGLRARRRKGETLDWKTISNNVLLAGLFVAMVTMFNQVNGRLNGMQAEMNRRFDIMQAENQRQHDAMQAENQRQHDVMQEVLRVFEGRTTRLEEKAGIGPENAE